MAVPVLHPAFILRGQERFIGVLERDLRRAARLAVSGWRREDRVWCCWDSDPVKCQAICNYAIQVLRYWRSTATAIGVDTETTGPRPTHCRLKTISVSPQGSREAIAVPVLPGVLDPVTREALVYELRALLGDEQITKIIHNLTFDVTVLERHGLPVRGPVIDTLVLAHIVDPSVPHDLQATASTYTDTEAWKVDFGSKEDDQTATLEDLLYYNGRDAIGCQQLAAPLFEIVQDYNLRTVAYKQTQYCELARRMETTGIYLDKAELDRKGRELFDRLNRLIHELRTELDWPDMDLGKPDHRAHFLYERLRLPVRSWTAVKHEPSTSYKSALDHLENPLVKKFVEIAELRHALSNFIGLPEGSLMGKDKEWRPRGYRKLLDPDSRLRVSWNPCGTVGPRWASSPNVQNVPAELRSIFGVPPGRVLVGADEEQLEYRISACFAGCVALLRAFAEGRDAHNLTAEAVFGDLFRNATPEQRKMLRYICKRVIYGLNYGAGSKKVTQVIREDKRTPISARALLTVERVAFIIAGIFRTYYEIPLWRTKTLDFANAHGYVEIPPFGRKCIFPAVPVEPTKAFNWPVQWTAGEIVADALLTIADRIPSSAFLVLNGHDAGWVECDEADGPTVAKIMEEAMEFRLEGPAGPVRLFAKAKIGHNGAEV